MSLEKATAPLDSKIASKLIAVLSESVITGTVVGGQLTVQEGKDSVSLSNVLLPDGNYSFDLSKGTLNAEATYVSELPAKATKAVPAPKTAQKESGSMHGFSASSAFAGR